MALTAKRVIAGIVVLLGLAMTGGGIWLASQIGPSGSATFSMTPNRSGAVVVTPNVLNRLDGDFVVRAVAPTSGGKVWMGTAAPSDADLIVGQTAATRLTGFSIRDGWVLRSTTTGSGDSPAFATADVWRATVAGSGEQTVVVSQDTAPESVVISAEGARLGKVTVTVERRAWFVQSLITAVVGLALLASGVLLWRSRIGGEKPRAPRPQPEQGLGADIPSPTSAETAPAGMGRRMGRLAQPATVAADQTPAVPADPAAPSAPADPAGPAAEGEAR